MVSQYYVAKRSAFISTVHSKCRSEIEGLLALRGRLLVPKKEVIARAVLYAAALSIQSILCPQRVKNPLSEN